MAVTPTSDQSDGNPYVDVDGDVHLNGTNVYFEVANFVADTTTGTKIGTGTTQKLGFFNATPVVQPSAYTQTYSTANKTVANATATAIGATLTDNTGQSGTHDYTLAATTVPAALTGGESPTEAEHNAVLTLLGVMVQNQSDVAQKVIELVTAVNALITDDLDNRQSVTAIIDDLQALGLAG